MSSEAPLRPVDSTPEATAFEQAQRAAELALAVHQEHPEDPGPWRAWEALAAARALMHGAYAADVFLYTARAAAAVAIHRAVLLIFDVAMKYHHPDPGRGAWHLHYENLPALGAWDAATTSSFAALAATYPSGFREDFERLRKGDTTALESAIRFLEADPWFFRSGYTKEYLVRFIGRCELSDAQAARLRQVVIQVIEGQDRREFRRYCRLAQRVSTPEFRAHLENISRPWDGSTPYESLSVERRRVQYDRRFKRHVLWVLAYLNGHPLPDRRTELRQSLAMLRVRSRRQDRRKATGE